MKTNQKRGNGWSKEAIQHLIDTNDKAVTRAVLAIYDLQTEVEKCNGQTSEHNGVGFSSFDSEILSSFAVQLKSKGFLSARQIEIARKKVRKYWKQLLGIAENSGIPCKIQVQAPLSL